MTIAEQLWFLVCIGGFLVFVEGAFGIITKLISQIFFKGRQITDTWVKLLGGLAIIILALVELANLPH